jgi:hypothetical protein
LGRWKVCTTLIALEIDKKITKTCYADRILWKVPSLFVVVVVVFGAVGVSKLKKE